MSATPDEQTLGSALRAAREGAGATVEQVAARTNIRATLIRDLEGDRFTSSGGTVYARGHVKSIAAALAVDPAPLLALFDQAVDAPVEVIPLAAPGLAADPAPTSFGGSTFAASAAAALRPERHGPRWGLAVAGAATLLAVITFVGYRDQPQTAGRADVLGGSPAATAQPTPSETAAVVPPQPDLSAQKPAVTGAQLRLRVIGGASWVSVSNPAKGTLFEGILKDGEFKDFTDPDRLKVVVGNALAVNLNCGGRDSGPAGGSGKVRTFLCTSTGLRPL